MSKLDRQDEPTSAGQNPSLTEDRRARRNRLAELLGRLLARFWLGRQGKRQSTTPQEDAGKP